MNKKYHLNGVYYGKIQQIYGIETAIDKSVVIDKIYLSLLGLTGDECADKRHHGGLDRALHQYPSEHYAYWAQHYQTDNHWASPGMGENLSTTGMTEDNVYLGDRYQWGEAIIEVSQPRSPCFKLNKRWGVADISKQMQDTSRCGWLYRVIEEGNVSIESPLTLIERVNNALTIREVCDLYFHRSLEVDALQQLLQQNRLAKSWQIKVRQRLKTGELENWNFRLFNHP